MTTFDFDREYLRNASTYRKSEKNFINHNPFHVGRKNYVNFVPQKKLYELILTHPSGRFSEDYISALRGCCPLLILHALDIDPGYLAHMPREMGSPKNYRENLKFCPKFMVLAPITSSEWEYPHETFPDDVPRGRGDEMVITF